MALNADNTRLFRLRHQLFALLFCLGAMMSDAAVAAFDIIGYYKFENASASNLAAPGKAMDVQNTSYANGGLYLNGIYEYESAKVSGFRAITESLDTLDYGNYSFIVEFNTDREGASLPILVQGTSFRSLQLMTGNGQLQLTFNNQSSSYALPGTSIAAKRWYKVALAFDLPNKAVRYAVDGASAQTVTLPTGFTLDILASQLAITDKSFTFTNYGNGTAFSGYVRNLVIFSRALSGSELTQYSKSLPAVPTTLMAPVCTLSASPASVAPGKGTTLTACCTPAADTMFWSCDTTCAFTPVTSALENCAAMSVTPKASTVYTVAGSNAAGTGSTARAAVTVSSDTTPPSAPANLTAKAISSTQVSLSWGASSDDVGVTAYKIYRPGVVCITSPCPGPTLLATVGNVTSHTLTVNAQDSTPRFQVVACDAANNCSAPSNAVSVTLPLDPPNCTLTAVPAIINPGGTSVLTASCSPAATAFVWRGGSCTGSTDASCTVKPTVSTSYSVVGSNASGTGNTATATVSVTAPTPPTAPPVCTLTAVPASITPGASSTLTASCSPAATAYDWSGGTCAGTTGATCTVKPALTTTYAVTGSNSLGKGNTARATVTPFAVQPVMANNVVNARITYNAADFNRGGSVFIYGYLPVNSPLLGNVAADALPAEQAAKAGTTLVFAVLTASGWRQILGSGGLDPTYTGSLNSSTTDFALYIAGLFDQFRDAGIICVAYTTSTGVDSTEQGLPVVIGKDPSVTCPEVKLTVPVVEFYHATLDNYFITADTSEALAIDGGSAGAGWSRTGNTFRSGGPAPVCRFYGSLSPGPNSHFYTASDEECTKLKDLQAATPATQKRWNFESLDFLTTATVNKACPANTTPVYRAYNNGFARGVDSNHRITSSQTAIQQVEARGWINEGVVMCAPQ